jgi:ABC-type multidrug transport system fused ATPase/permease subunit
MDTGKSSLLSSLLGELNLKSGTVQLSGSIAYCDQRPWILNATVKENILFGLDYDETLFQLAVHASSLEDDIKILPGGVLTEIGEKGINLSGKFIFLISFVCPFQCFFIILCDHPRRTKG